MKFRTKTYMVAASREEVVAAAQQGALLETEIDDIVYGTPLSSMSTGSNLAQQEQIMDDKSFVWIATSVLVVGVVTLLGVAYWVRTRRTTSTSSVALKESLLS
jgi:hypothetical protein